MVTQVKTERGALSNSIMAVLQDKPKGILATELAALVGSTQSSVSAWAANNKKRGIVATLGAGGRMDPFRLILPKFVEAATQPPPSPETKRALGIVGIKVDKVRFTDDERKELANIIINRLLLNPFGRDLEFLTSQANAAIQSPEAQGKVRFRKFQGTGSCRSSGLVKALDEAWPAYLDRLTKDPEVVHETTTIEVAHEKPYLEILAEVPWQERVQLLMHSLIGDVSHVLKAFAPLVENLPQMLQFVDTMSKLSQFKPTIQSHIQTTSLGMQPKPVEVAEQPQTKVKPARIGLIFATHQHNIQSLLKRVSDVFELNILSAGGKIELGGRTTAVVADNTSSKLSPIRNGVREACGKNGLPYHAMNSWREVEDKVLDMAVTRRRELKLI